MFSGYARCWSDARVHRDSAIVTPGREPATHKGDRRASRAPASIRATALDDDDVLWVAEGGGMAAYVIDF